MSWHKHQPRQHKKGVVFRISKAVSVALKCIHFQLWSQHMHYVFVCFVSLSESLRGARVLVTGASTGIGEQMAYHYARFGAQIVITARREKVLQQVSELNYINMDSKIKPINIYNCTYNCL